MYSLEVVMTITEQIQKSWKETGYDKVVAAQKKAEQKWERSTRFTQQRSGMMFEPEFDRINHGPFKHDVV